MTDVRVPSSRRHRALLWSGVGMLLAGLLVIGYIGWQLWGTTWVAKREQHRVVERTEREWSGGQGEVSGPAAGVDALVRVPAFGEDYVVPAYVGTDDGTLSRGFGIFDGSPAPGGVGNLAISGHRITHGEPLRDLPDLEAGDEVMVETQDAIHTYVLDTDGEDLSVDFDADWVIGPDPTDPATGVPASEEAGTDRLLTLVTCAELFHTDDRLVVFGHLESTEQK